MVIIDDVYQKVLALANKEQRGYITPQEFNLFANKAQLEIFDGYFYDFKTAYHKPKTNMTFGDEMDILAEKIHPFKRDVTFELEGESLITLPGNLYLIDTLAKVEGKVVEMSENDILYTENNPLTRATLNRSVYVRRINGAIQVYPTPSVNTSYTLNYYKKPYPPKWSYVVVNGRALYNQNLSVNFELHASEEEMLVTRILMMAGVTIQKPQLVQQAAQEGAGLIASKND